MQKPYKTLSDMAEDEFVEQRSRFIGAVSPAANAEEAAAFIQKRRKMHPDARHHVFAYTLLDGTCRCSDDGEPQGTGGVPLLTVLQGNELFNAVVVVTRYFGGILLGTGGLSRAYTQGAKLAVSAGHIVMMQMCVEGGLFCSYAQYGWVQPFMAESGVEILETQYAEEIHIRFRLPEKEWDIWQHAVLEKSAGTLEASEEGRGFFPFWAG